MKRRKLSPPSAMTAGALVSKSATSIILRLVVHLHTLAYSGFILWHC